MSRGHTGSSHGRDDESVPSALLITGTVGAGKTVVAEYVGELLGRRGIANAVIDLDWLRRLWPSPEEDRLNSAIELRNLRSLAGNYLAAGAVRLVLAGVTETVAQRGAYQAALGVPLSVGRLQVELELVQTRLARRHEADEAELRWHLDRSTELDGILQSAGVEDYLVEATQGSPSRSLLA